MFVLVDAHLRRRQAIADSRQLARQQALLVRRLANAHVDIAALLFLDGDTVEARKHEKIATSYEQTADELDRLTANRSRVRIRGGVGGGVGGD